ncbi:DUF3253 domain-containing protein [Falsiroseomonas selenitidurans]|uniref:DUF3253 domain-containing protein n=1 Tax=Falsiroseomonas selenitidurans TaxID=2716335 RepID=A0ABX1DZG5_9PROT|nr:DUF3253 domain-containing protein [Falsiroseomonas selenitidurans]NKC30299.1 DUF3253 domain-containing protein [Falsiroseomonas selenitidurans]
MIAAEAIAAEILRQTTERGPGRSICPSEVARALAPEEDAWRRLMGPVRAAAIRLARSGQVEVLRKGRPVSPDAEIRGVIRLRIAAGPGDLPPDQSPPDGAQGETEA